MMTPRAKKGAKIFLGIVVLWLVLSCLGIPVPGVDVAFFLLGGWVFFLVRVVPQVRVRWELVGSAAVYVIAMVAGAHYFLRWLYGGMSRADTAGAGESRGWRLPWTLGGFLILVLMFASGMAAIGIAHQTAWLLSGPEPIFEYHFRGRETANRVKCASNLRQIGQAIKLYAKDHQGHYPDDLPALLEEDLTAGVFVCPSANDLPATAPTRQELAANIATPHHCSYLYLGKGLVEPIDPKRVIAWEPLTDHQRVGMNVLFGDGSVKWLNRVEAEALLDKIAPNKKPSEASTKSG